MLSREVVGFQLTYLATALRRKLDQRVIDIYHQRLERNRIEEPAFVAACGRLADEADKFPSIGEVLGACRSSHRGESGVPYIRGAGPLSECLADLDAGHSYRSEEQYRGRKHANPMIERLIYEEAAALATEVPGEVLSARLRRIVAKAEEVFARIDASEEARRMAPEGPGPSQGEL